MCYDHYMTNTAAALIHFPIITGHLSSHEAGPDMGIWGFILLAVFAVAMVASMWFALTDSGNAAWVKITKRFRKAR